MSIVLQLLQPRVRAPLIIFGSESENREGVLSAAVSEWGGHAGKVYGVGQMQMRDAGMRESMRAVLYVATRWT